MTIVKCIIWESSSIKNSILHFDTINLIIGIVSCDIIVYNLSNIIIREALYVNFIWEVVKLEINIKCTVIILWGLENEILFEILYQKN